MFDVDEWANQVGRVVEQAYTPEEQDTRQVQVAAIEDDLVRKYLARHPEKKR